MDPILTFNDEAGNRFEIFHDEDAESPREWSNLGTIYSNHRRYSPDCHSIEEICPNAIDPKALDREYLWLKVWGYEHSGLTITAGPREYPYNDRWDSGLFAIIAVPRTKVREEYKVKRITPNIRKEVLNCLAGEIATLNQYYTGEVYGFKKFDEDGNETDSCWGFFYDDLDDLKRDLLAEYGED